MGVLDLWIWGLEEVQALHGLLISKKGYVLQKELKQVPDLIFHISTGLEVGNSKYPTVK